MADVFLSYSREDQSTARRVAEGLEQAGLTVWWDQALRSGEAYDRVTEKALEDARAVVVLWSKTSVESRWVRTEATQADRDSKLVPAMIEPCKRPIMFELTHTTDLSNWKGDRNDPAWRAYVADVRTEYARIAEAHEVLADPDRRRDYDPAHDPFGDVEKRKDLRRDLDKQPADSWLENYQGCRNSRTGCLHR